MPDSDSVSICDSPETSPAPGCPSSPSCLEDGSAVVKASRGITETRCCRSVTLPKLLQSGLVRRDSADDGERLACYVPRDASGQICACLFTTNKLYNIKRHMERKHREVWNHFLASGDRGVPVTSRSLEQHYEALATATATATAMSATDSFVSGFPAIPMRSTSSGGSSRRKRPYDNPPVRITSSTAESAVSKRPRATPPLAPADIKVEVEELDDDAYDRKEDESNDEQLPEQESLGASTGAIELRSFLAKFVPPHVIRALELCAVDSPLLVAGLRDADMDRVERTVRLMAVHLAPGGAERRALLGGDSAPALFLAQPARFLLLPGYRIGLRLAAEELSRQMLEHASAAVTDTAINSSSSGDVNSLGAHRNC